MNTRRFVIAGNGPSIAQLPPGVLHEDDFIIRVNNFFFEPLYYLGRRVDLAYMAGDPRVAPFMFETLHQWRADYDLRALSSHNPKVWRAGQRRFADLLQPMRYRDAQLEADVQQLITQSGRHPTSGIYAILLAHAMGASEILMLGFDFYAQPQRYPFSVGRHYRGLMGQDVAQRGMDRRLHDQELDLDILRLLKRRADVTLLMADDIPVLHGIAQVVTPQKTVSQIPHMLQPRPDAPKDWVAWSGFYPIACLKLLRRLSACWHKMVQRLENGFGK